MSANEKLPDDLEFEDAPDDLDDAIPPVMAPLRTATPASDTPTYVMGQPEPTALERLGAFLRGGAQGATFRWGDEISSRLAPTASDETGIPRNYRAGSAQADLQSTMQRENAEAQAMAPGFYGAGEVVGGTVATAPLIAVNPAGTAARIATNTGLGTATGALTAAGGAAEGRRGAAAVEGGVTGGMLAGGLTAGAASIPRMVKPLSDWAAREADLTRFGATGAFAQQVKALKDEKGLDYVRQLGQHAEELKRQAGGLKRFLPWSADDYLAAAGKAGDVDNAAIGSQLATAADEGARVMTDPVADAIEAKARTYGGPLGTDVADAQSMRALSEASRLRTKPTPLLGNESVDAYSLSKIADPVPAPMSLSPQQALAQKKEWERLAGYRSDRIATLPKGATPEMYGDMATPMRRALYETMDTTTQGPAFRQSMENYGKNATIVNAADKRVMHELGNQSVSLPSAVLASGGLAAGGPLGAVASGAAAGATKTYGKDMGAAAYRTLSNMAGGVADTAPLVNAVTNPAVQQSYVRTAVNANISPAFSQDRQPQPAEDLATKDPQFGAMLAAQPAGEKRRAAYATLKETSPEFRERDRLRSLQQSHARQERGTNNDE